MPSPFIKSALGIFLVFGTLLACGCGAPAESVPNSEPVQTDTPPQAQDDPNVFNVAIFTPFETLYIDDFELEFNQRRGFRAFMGFDEANFSTLTSVPWRNLQRVDFEGLVDASVWEQIFSGREDQTLTQEQIHKILLQFEDGSSRYFYAAMTKFRGYKDGVQWEYNMVGNENVDYILFNP